MLLTSSNYHLLLQSHNTANADLRSIKNDTATSFTRVKKKMRYVKFFLRSYRDLCSEWLIVVELYWQVNAKYLSSTNCFVFPCLLYNDLKRRMGTGVGLFNYEQKADNKIQFGKFIAFKIWEIYKWRDYIWQF